MSNRHDRDDDERNRGEFSAGPFGRHGFDGEYARDRHRGGYGGEYARDGGWSGGGRGEDYVRENFWGGTGAAGDWHGGATEGRRGSSYLGYGPARTRSTYGGSEAGGSAVPYGETDPTARISHRGRGPKNWRPSEERIRESVNEMLTDHDEVDASDIEVEVKGAEVTLTGQVASRWEKRLAEDIAASARGVHDVHNRLQVRTSDTRIGNARE